MSQTRLKLHFASSEPFSEYFEFQNPATPIPDALRIVTESEVVHYDYIFGQPMLQNRDHFNRNKEPHIYGLLYALGFHVHQIDGDQKACLQL